jgi:5-methylcytosine-specific restriction endonuclease McrA
MEQTLLLNVTFEPIKVVSWQRAMTLWAQNKVEIVHTHDREVNAVSFSFKLPSVVRLLRFVRIRQRKDYVPFTRANIFARDEFTCQYCGQRHASEDLTYDHVIPQARGGKRTWDNIVSACVPCNKRKADKTPAEAGMHLRRTPKKPNSSPIFRVTFGMRTAPESWLNYLYWNAELVTDE